ncbi:MAG: PilN domain-containing protein [Candidatus Acidiferrales bacterium]|jgi:Tfp pilus assembly protein PilN
MRARLNLATLPLVSHRRFTVGASIVGSVAIVVMFVLAGNAYRSWRGDTEFRTRQAELLSEIAVLQQHHDELNAYFKRPDTVARGELANYLNGLIEERSFPWTKVFQDLEQTLPDGVHVVSIQPTLVNGEIRLSLSVEAVNDDAKLKFLKALESSPEFSRLQVQSESKPTNAQGVGPDQVDLKLTAWYSTI